jgi:integrase
MDQYHLYKINSRIDKNNNVPLRFVLNKAGIPITLQSIFKVPNKKWNQEKQRVDGDPDLTSEITKHREKFTNMIEILYDNGELTQEKAKNHFQLYFRDETHDAKLKASYSNNNFLKYFDITKKRLEQQGKSKNHCRKFGYVKDRVEEVFGKSISVKELNLDWLGKFTEWHYEKEITCNTVRDHWKIVRLAAKSAVMDGHRVDSLFLTFTIPENDGTKFFLTKDEVTSFMQVEPIKEGDEYVKDWFILQMLTGVRFSDFPHIKASNLGADGTLSFAIQKTSKQHKIPIDSMAIRIIERWGEWNGMYLQQYNERIKQLCRKAKINQIMEKIQFTGGNKVKKTTEEKWKFISSHDGRRTFARTVYESKKWTLEELSTYLGHSSTSQTLEYIDLKKEDLKPIENLYG